MWYDAELVVKNYKPLQLEPGMLFVQKLHQGTLKEEVEIFILERVPQDEESFLQQHGYPVELYIIDENGDMLASNEEIALWDDGEEELFEISVDHVNKIFNEYDGMVQIEMVDISEEEDEYEEWVPVVYEGNIILRYPQEEYEEWEEEEELPMCEMCNGTGEGANPDLTCIHCKGSGVIYPDDYEP